MCDPFRRSLLAAISILCFAFAAAPPLAADPSLRFPAGQPDAVIPARRAHDMLLVPVRLNGADPVWFLLSTGQRDSIIDPAVAQRLGLPAIQAATAPSAAPPAAQAEPVYRAVESLSVGGVLAPHMVLTESPALTAYAKVFVNTPLAGVLGMDFLGRAPFTIDFPAATLTLHEPTSFRPPAGLQPLELRMLGDAHGVPGLPAVRLEIDGEASEWFILHSSAMHSLALNPAFIHLHPNLFSEGRWHRMLDLEFGSIQRLRLVMLGPLRVLGQTIVSAEAQYTQPTDSDPPDIAAGTIGAHLLRGLSLTLDCQHGQAYAEKRRTSRPSEWDAPGFNAGTPDAMGATPLMHAAELGELDYVKRFLAAAGGVNAADSIEGTALIYAASGGDTPTIRLLLAAGAEANQPKGESARTPLMVAARHGHAAAVAALLTGGAKPDLQDAFGCTALIMAAEAGDAESAKALLHAKADPNINSPAFGTALGVAAAHGHLALARLLLEAGADPNRPGGTDRTTPTAMAAFCSSADMLRLLLAHGGRTDDSDRAGTTAILNAAGSGRIDSLDLLLELGAFAGVVDRTGAGLMEYARRNGHLDVMAHVYFNPPPALALARPQPATGPATTRPAAAPQSIRFPSGMTAVTLALKRVDDRFQVPVQINGSDVNWFLLDTGFDTTTISPALADRLKLPSLGPTTVNGLGGKSEAQFHAADSVSVAGVTLVQTIIDALPDIPGAYGTLRASATREQPATAAAAASTPSKERGVLGMDFLGRIPFTLDYPAATLTLFAPDAFRPPAGAARFDIRRINRKAAVQVQIRDRTMDWFLLDTGANDWALLAAPFARLHPELITARAGEIPGLALGGQSTAQAAAVGPVRWLGQQTMTLQAPIVSDAGNLANSETAGDLGGRMLRELSLTVDVCGGNAWVQKPSVTHPHEWDHAGFDAAAPDPDGFTPLMRAAAIGEEAYARRFLAAGGDLNAVDGHGATALAYAALCGRSPTVKLLLAAGARPDGGPDRTALPLRTAVAARMPEAAAELLRGGAGVNAQGPDGATALVAAVVAGDLPMVRTLLAAKADPNLATTGAEPLGMAAWNGRTDHVAVLLQAGAQVDVPPGTARVAPLLMAAASGSPETVQLLLAHGAPVDQTDRGGHTPLFIAAIQGDPVILDILLHAGANPTAVDHNGQTALDFARAHGRTEAMAELYFATKPPATTAPAAKPAAK